MRHALRIVGVLFVGVVAFLAFYFLQSGPSVEQGFLSRKRSLPELGTFQIRNGYVTSLITNGREWVSDPQGPDGRWFLNNPLSAGGIGNFGFTVWGERRSLSHPAVEHRDPILVDNGRGMAQLHRFPEGFAVNTRWTWTATELHLLASVHVRPGVAVKEPEFAVSIKGADSVVIPACRTYLVRADADPRRSTGHCDNADRSSFDVGPFHFDVDDDQLRGMAGHAREWRPLGDEGCGWRPLMSSWEIVVWHGIATILLKSWDGCVTATDAAKFFRHPPERSRVDFGLTMTRRS